MSDWNTQQYLKFKYERTQPVIDLVNRINCNNPKKIIDIGCGPGNSTLVLREKFPDAEIIGVDNSENMINMAKAEFPNMTFKIFDAGADLAVLGDDYDIVFSNACIQWIPNHEQLLINMIKILKSGGILAIQTPMNFNEPIHNIINSTAQNNRWKKYYPTIRKPYNLLPEQYFNILSELSAESAMWETTYFHIMKSHKDLLDYCRTTGLRPFLDVLPEKKKRQFEDEIMEKTVNLYKLQKNGEIISKCPRLFFIAKK